MKPVLSLLLLPTTGERGQIAAYSAEEKARKTWVRVLTDTQLDKLSNLTNFHFLSRSWCKPCRWFGHPSTGSLGMPVVVLSTIQHHPGSFLCLATAPHTPAHEALSPLEALAASICFCLLSSSVL